jgi:hypothetical protein
MGELSMNPNEFQPKTRSLNFSLSKWLSGSLALAALFTACGSDDAPSSASGNGPNAGGEVPALPAELDFTSINQEFQQQQQQFGPNCPKKFVAQVQQNGQVIIINQRGQTVLQGQTQASDFAKLANSANDALDAGFEQQVECQPSQQTNSGSGSGIDFLETQQVFVTNKQNQTTLVAAKKGDKVCDFSKGGKGKQLQEQMVSVVQQACGGGLPSPSPTPSPSPSPSASPSPSPSPSPGTGGVDPSPSPSPSASPSPSPSPGTANPNDLDPTRDQACTDAVAPLGQLIADAKRCTVDTDCVYLNAGRIIPRERTNELIVDFSCGDATPNINIANRGFIEANGSDIADRLNRIRNSCDLNTIVSDCNAIGAFPSTPPPVCRQNVCVREVNSTNTGGANDTSTGGTPTGGSGT